MSPGESFAHVPYLFLTSFQQVKSRRRKNPRRAGIVSARGGSATRSISARSAAAAKGWASRKARKTAMAAMTPAELATLRGSHVDRVLPGSDIRALIDRTIAALREREEQ